MSASGTVGLKHSSLGLKLIDKPHRAPYVAEWALNQLLDFGITYNPNSPDLPTIRVTHPNGTSSEAPLMLSTVTTDNASNMTSAVAELRLLRAPCCAHVLNLCIKDVLDAKVGTAPPADEDDSVDEIVWEDEEVEMSGTVVPSDSLAPAAAAAISNPPSNSVKT